MMALLRCLELSAQHFQFVFYRHHVLLLSSSSPSSHPSTPPLSLYVCLATICSSFYYRINFQHELAFDVSSEVSFAPAEHLKRRGSFDISQSSGGH